MKVYALIYHVEYEAQSVRSVHASELGAWNARAVDFAEELERVIEMDERLSFLPPHERSRFVLDREAIQRVVRDNRDWDVEEWEVEP